MKGHSLLVISGLALTSALLVSVQRIAVVPTLLAQQSQAAAGAESSGCSGGPCDAATRGLRAFFDRDLAGLGGNGH